MGKLFGTDGYRGIVNDDLNVDIALKIGVSVAHVFKKEMKKETLNFLIGGDTRLSKDMLSNAVAAGALSEGCNIIDVGIIPSPAVSYLMQKYDADGGFIITASHNPSEHNGIKVLMKDGFKMDEALEEKVEDFLLNHFEYNKKVNNNGKYIYKQSGVEDYADYLVDHAHINLGNKRILIDTANGAAYDVADKVFKRLNVDYEIMNNTPDGLNINQNAGSTHLDNLIKRVIEEKFDLGIAYDGDADRCLLVDELGNIIDGDFILAIVGNELYNENKLVNNTLVGTIMSNLGLIKFCEERNISFVATKVGDKYVLEEMLNNNYILGGEASGHIIFKEYENTGDGIFTSIQILNIMTKTNKKLSELASIMKKYPQILKNAIVSKDGKEKYKTNENIKNKIIEMENKLSGTGRIVIRPSGTENLIRVMLEGSDMKELESMCDELISFIEKELN